MVNIRSKFVCGFIRQLKEGWLYKESWKGVDQRKKGSGETLNPKATLWLHSPVINQLTIITTEPQIACGSVCQSMACLISVCLLLLL